MSMRITNKMMTSNTNTNINNNKVSVDRLNTQVSTQKKISRPSEDPVVAIRALRLRSSLNEISQYYEKNIPDAKSWLEVTESALKTTQGAIEDMYEYCVQGSSDELTATDRAKVLANLKELKSQVYSAGNADYAGRTVFTGYRTGESLTYGKDTAQNFSITEGFNAADIDTIKYVSGKVDVNNIAATDPTDNEVHRIRLSYDEMDATTTPHEIEYKTPLADATSSKTATGFTITTTPTPGGTATTYTITQNADGTYTSSAGSFVKNEDGTFTLTEGITKNADGSHTMTAGNVTVNLTSTGAVQNFYTTSSIEVVSKTLAGDGDSAYVVNEPADANKAYYIAETGEMILGSTAYNTLSNLKNIEGTDVIGFTYDKGQWSKGDLRPEHYFNCVDTTDALNPINHVYSEQIIAYDVSANQNLRVNTLAGEVYDHDITRDIDEMINATQAVIDAEDKITKLKAMQSDSQYDETQQATIASMLEEAEKEKTLLQDKMENLFKSNITNSQEYLDQTNLAIANCGARGTSLTLTTTRMKEQQTSVNQLASENENVDVATAAIDLANAELAYDAALLAAGKISQQTLLNYL
ncbi:MAG: hypothetical protein Q4G60_01315 [bacterium]|nr:hypothetical protein [bacterium]